MCHPVCMKIIFYLEVDVHGVRELECLEVGVGDHGGRGAEVLDLLEAGHDLGPSYAANLVDELSVDVSFMLWIVFCPAVLSCPGFLTPLLSWETIPFSG